MHLDQPVDDAGPLAEPGPQFPAAGVAGCGDLLEADGAVGQVGADRPAQEAVLVEDPDLGHVARVVADDDALADVGGQHRVQVAQRLEVDAVGVDRARPGDGQEQQVELFQRAGHARDEGAGLPPLLRRHAGLTMRRGVVGRPDEHPDRLVELGQAQPGLPRPVPGAARRVPGQVRQAHLVESAEDPLDFPAAGG